MTLKIILIKSLLRLRKIQIKLYKRICKAINIKIKHIKINPMYKLHNYLTILRHYNNKLHR